MAGGIGAADSVARAFSADVAFALVNHRFAERRPTRICRQVGLLLAYIAFGAVACYDLFVFLSEHRATTQIPSPSSTASAIPSMPMAIRHGMNPAMMKRYGLLPRNASVQIATNLEDPPQVQSPPQPPRASSPTQVSTGMNLELMKRYGLRPPARAPAISASTNSAGKP